MPVDTRLVESLEVQLAIAQNNLAYWQQVTRERGMKYSEALRRAADAELVKSMIEAEIRANAETQENTEFS